MAGRGRGRTQFTFNVDSLGFGRGEALPASALVPSPLFPPLQFRPVPLPTGEEVDYMLALKQELRASSKILPSHIRPGRVKIDVDRYSDKYQSGEPKHSAVEWNPGKSKKVHDISLPFYGGHFLTFAIEMAFFHCWFQQTLEKNEKNQSEGEEDEEKKKTGEEEEESGEGEDYDEEEFEEETDYIMSYFDNGEDFGGDSDDNMDEATY
uniref:DNA-directed RNA polymerase III subunit n=1 Tax=Electrophorus electricus TaxID=8005 RepID=A0A4W4HEU2_ELEEL